MIGFRDYFLDRAMSDFFNVISFSEGAGDFVYPADCPSCLPDLAEQEETSPSRESFLDAAREPSEL